MTNKLIRLIGKVLSLPFKIVSVPITIGLLPIKVLINWLDGYGNYNKIYCKFAKCVIKSAWEALKRGEKPVLKCIMQYDDDKYHIQFLNDKECPHCAICETENGILTKSHVI